MWWVTTLHAIMPIWSYFIVIIIDNWVTWCIFTLGTGIIEIKDKENCGR